MKTMQAKDIVQGDVVVWSDISLTVRNVVTYGAYGQGEVTLFYTNGSKTEHTEYEVLKVIR